MSSASLLILCLVFRFGLVQNLRFLYVSAMNLGRVIVIVSILTTTAHGINDPSKGCESRVALSGFPGAVVYQLGKGNTGTVYRIEAGDRAPYPLKVYHDVKRGYDRDTGMWQVFFKSIDLRDKDALFMSLFHVHAKSGLDLGFTIPETKSISVDLDPALEFESGFAGEDVYKIMTAPETTPESGARVLQQYQKSLDRFRHYLETHHKGEIDVRKTAARLCEPKPNKYELPFLEMRVTIVTVGMTRNTSIHLTADGVIFDPMTEKMYLVDPD